MDRVGNTKLPESLRLEFQELVASVVHSTAHPAILPTSVVQACQLGEFLANLVR